MGICWSLSNSEGLWRRRKRGRCSDKFVRQWTISTKTALSTGKSVRTQPEGGGGLNPLLDYDMYEHFFGKAK